MGSGPHRNFPYGRDLNLYTKRGNRQTRTKKAKLAAYGLRFGGSWGEKGSDICCCRSFLDSVSPLFPLCPWHPCHPSFLSGLSPPCRSSFKAHSRGSVASGSSWHWRWQLIQQGTESGERRTLGCSPASGREFILLLEIPLGSSACTSLGHLLQHCVWGVGKPGRLS